MRRTWSLLLSSLASNISSKSTPMSYHQLAQCWSKEFENGHLKVAGLSRTIPLLEDPTSIPFVCRYRTDLIQPLSVREVHQLSEMLRTHKSLQSLRQKILDKLPPATTPPSLLQRVQCSLSKSDLEEIYAPLKPPSKGSLEQRILQEHPHLKALVQDYWNGNAKEHHLKPRDAAVILLANLIASHTETTDALLEYVERYAKVATSPTKADPKSNKDFDKKYSTYYNFSIPLQHIRDHQVLAIRRGVDQKALQFSFEIDAERTESRIRRSLLDNQVIPNSSLWKEAIHNAWTRLLRKRVTTRLWKDKTLLAQQKSIQVFCDNLIKALLAPPLKNPTPLLAMDPGFQAGIKCAVLDANGQLLFGEESLVTIHFLSSSQRTEALTKLTSLLQIVYSAIETTNNRRVTIALGNGHGSAEARDLIRHASDACHIPIDIQLVNEAGASVWSVTESAQREFPHQPPAAIAAVSIGRRYQNPLPELVKIPPRSLGLGLYQHDLSESELDEKLHSTSVHAVAEVGVDGNACSLEILEKIPGLTRTLGERIMAQRPLHSRLDLLTRVTGLGPKTFENCAAFIRIENSKEPLDRTLVHPESYELARYLLKQCQWKLDDPASIGKADTDKDKIVETAATKFQVSSDRVKAVMQHLKTSITNPDPRLGNGGGLSIVGSSLDNNKHTTDMASSDDIGSIDGCSFLPSHLSKSTDALRKACPLRGIVATVRNVVDFGAFLDFGGENDGLLHRSKLGSDQNLSSLLVGQEVGVDILSVSPNGRVSLALNGLNLDPDPAVGTSSGGTATGKRSFSTSTSTKKPAAKKRRIEKNYR